MIIAQERAEHIEEADGQDRIVKERKGVEVQDVLKINPHKVQMFSLNEIWKSVLEKLVELNVLQDPDADAFLSDEDSDELKDEFDFVVHGSRRIGRLLKEKRSKQQKEKPLRELMPKNDFAMINKMLQKVVEHEKFVKGL